MTDFSKTAIEHEFAGRAVPSHAKLRCAMCGHRLTEGARVAVDGRRDADEGFWRFDGTYCADHDRRLERDFSDDDTALLHARVGVLADTAEQVHSPALLDVELVDVELKDERIEA